MKMPDIKKPEIKKPDIVGKIKSSSPSSAKRKRPSKALEKAYESRLLILSILAILMYIIIAWAVVAFTSDESMNIQDIIRGSAGSVFALLFAVIIMDRINARKEKRVKKREERKAIVRHNKIIQPMIDMYLVRKNMVITPNDKTVRKFQVSSTFNLKDMKDMYGPSELISDVGKSKLDVYSYYQDKLNEVFTHLVEDVDFDNYSDLCDAAMDYINATSYGASALDAVAGYQNMLTGTKSMKSVVLNMIRDEPEGGKFIDAPTALKNVYLLHQMINDQSVALAKYLKIVRVIIAEDDKELGADSSREVDYE